MKRSKLLIRGSPEDIAGRKRIEGIFGIELDTVREEGWYYWDGSEWGGKHDREPDTPKEIERKAKRLRIRERWGNDE